MVLSERDASGVPVAVRVNVTVSSPPILVSELLVPVLPKTARSWLSAVFPCRVRLWFPSPVAATERVKVMPSAVTTTVPLGDVLCVMPEVPPVPSQATFTSAELWSVAPNEMVFALADKADRVMQQRAQSAPEVRRSEVRIFMAVDE